MEDEVTQLMDEFEPERKLELNGPSRSRGATRRSLVIREHPAYELLGDLGQD